MSGTVREIGARGIRYKKARDLLGLGTNQRGGNFVSVPSHEIER